MEVGDSQASTSDSRRDSSQSTSDKFPANGTHSRGSSSVDGASFSQPAKQSEQDSVSLTGDNEDYMLFRDVIYLGAVSVKSARSESEILLHLASMNDAYSSNNDTATAIKVDLLVPRVPQGVLTLFTPQTDEEISRYPIFRIIFCARGARPTEVNDPLSSCFAFTFGVGNGEEAVFLCHAFRCQSPEQVSNIVSCFANAFRKPAATQLPQGESVFVFDVCVEAKEDDGKGSTVICPRESRDCFKFRTNLVKYFVIHILQVSPENPHLSLDRCTGILLAAGKVSNRSDFTALPVQSWDNNGKQFNITCKFDPRDQKFLLLNTETPGEHRSQMTLVVNVAIIGISEPVSFVLHCRARIFPQVEKFWIPSRKSLQETFYLRLLWNSRQSDPSSPKGRYSFISLESQSRREGRDPDISSVLQAEAPSEDEDSGEMSDDEEPLMSGFGQVSKECSQEELQAWSAILAEWRQNLSVRPRGLSQVVRRRGIPQSLRCEVWQLLSGCARADNLLEEYKTLSYQESSWEAEILKDISRTFPAHEYFKTKGSEGQEQLFRVVKAYSIRDAETGYCQNMSFIVATLLLHMPEELAYCLLVKMMETYHLRDLMMNDFEGLRLRFYQFQRLLEEKIPDLYYHFQQMGVEVHMYASQWFLTLFTAKFPLVCVYRIIDSFLCDGILVLFQVALGLLKIAKQDLLQLDFEGLLKYFRVTIPKRYRSEDTVELLMNHALHEKIQSKKMMQYEKEYAAQRATDTPDSVIDRLKRLNREQMTNIMRLERENDQLAHELISGRIQLRNELDELEMQLDMQQKESAKLKRLAGETEEELKRTRDENFLLKDLCRKIENDNTMQKKSVAEYKAINGRLTENVEQANQRIALINERLCGQCREAFNSDELHSPVKQEPGEEDRIKQLELELARTKLALVEKECYTQELLHQLATFLPNGQPDPGKQPVRTSNSWLTKTLNSIKSQAAVAANSASISSLGSDSCDQRDREKRSDSLHDGVLQQPL